MKLRVLVPTTISTVLLCLCLSPAAIAQSVGAIGGTVQDATGAVIPGVTVILSNPGTIGGNQQVVTDERGVYLFGRLVPSKAYVVKAELPGFRTAIRNSVPVNADVTARVDLTLEVGEVSDTLTVTGEAPLLDTTSVFNQTVLERVTLDSLPTGRDVWSIGRVVPGVIMNKYDVGGSESMYASTISLHGAPNSEGQFLVDGVDVATTSNPGSTAAYFDTSMFQEINYQAGNAPAESDRGGIVINMVSRTGTNDFHGQFNFTGTTGPMNSDNLTPKQSADLLAAVPARVLAASPNIVPTGRIQSLYNSAVALNGPIVRDKLWFSTSGQLAQVNRFWLGSYNTDGSQILDDSRQHAWSMKLSWQTTPSTQIHYLHSYSYRANLHRAASAVGGIANDFYEARAMTTQFLPTNIDQVRVTSALSSRFVIDASVSRYRSWGHIPDQPQVKPGDIPRFDSVTRTYTVAYPLGNEQWYRRDPVKASLNYVAGSHDVNVGYQGQIMVTRTFTYTFSHYPSGLVAIYRNGVPDSVNTYNAPVGTRQNQLDHAIYIQDKWKTARKLTLNLGLRLQKTYGQIPAACQVRTIFTSEQCFGEVRNVPNWLDLAPRFGLIYDLFGNGKTALKLAANRYDVPVGTGISANVNPIKSANDTRSWNDNGDGIPQLDELGPSTGFNIGTTNRYNPNVKRPYTNELNVEVQQQFPGNLLASVIFFHRELRRDIGSKNLAVPRESYTPLVVTEKTSGRQVTVYNQDPARRGKFDVLFDNFAELNGHFNGLDVTFNKRLSNRWMLMGGLSLGRNVADIYGTADLNNPNNAYRRGVIGQDVPVQFKASGVYQLPYGVSVSANAQHFSGFPELDTVTVNSNTVALTQVSQSVAVAPRGTNRLDSVNVVDFSGRKTFKYERLTAEPVVELFNLFNASPVQGRTTVLGPAYHRAASIMRGRMLKFGVDVKF